MIRTNSCKSAYWSIRGEALLAPDAPFGIMGVVNCTPDSFYEPSRHTDPSVALTHALSLLDEGADILDLGGESTRPGAEEVSSAEEIGRVLPLFKAVREKAPNAVFAIDTWHAATAATFLDYGAEIINDVSGGLWDPEMPSVIAQYRPGYVLTYAQESHARRHVLRETDNIVADALTFFEKGLTRLTRAGLPEDNIVLDPGIGFGTSTEQICELLANVQEFHSFGRPLLAGIAEKRFLSDILSVPVCERQCPTQIATAILWSRGVFWHRVHHVADTRQTLLLASSISQ